MTKLIYFAWVRERIGKSEEEIALPASVNTVSDLLLWLKARGEGRIAKPSSSTPPQPERR